LNILFIAKNVTVCERTGDAIHVREVSKELTERGHKVIILGRDLQSVPKKVYDDYQRAVTNLEADKNIKVVQMNPKMKLSNPQNRDFQTMKHSLAILRNYEIDLIYSRSFNAYVEGILAKLWDIPLVLEINGMELEEREAMKGKTNVMSKAFVSYSSLLFFQKTSHIIAVTEHIKNQLMDEYEVSRNKMSVVPNGVNEKLFKPDPKQRDLIRKTLGIGLEKRVICFVGAFDPWHGLELLVRSAKHVVEDEPDVVFLMVGDGSMRRTIEKMVKAEGLQSNFIFTGMVPYNRVPSYINASDLCSAPYPKAGAFLIDWSPLKLFEYLASGTPVIATDVGNVARVIKASGGGVVVEPDNPRAYARGILDLFKNEKKQKRMGKSGRKYVLKNCTWGRTAERVIEVMENALS
jgi:glycosyltransferase involved in cell wall biosynthesis